MRPLRLRIRAESQRQGTPQHFIEKDYVLSYIKASTISLAMNLSLRSTDTGIAVWGLS